MNSIINYNYNLINIVWNDRGIKLMIIYNILKYYNKLKNKNIIIENFDYRYFCKMMFSELKFKKFNKKNINDENNFYFNIRKILVKKNIFIDNIYNYVGKKIPGKKIYLIPWFDVNDPIISFRYTSGKKKNFSQVCNKIILFGNFYRTYSENTLWDNIIELKIINKYKDKYLIENINLVYIKFFTLLKKYYISIQKPLELDNDLLKLDLFKEQKPKIIEKPEIKIIEKPKIKIIEREKIVVKESEDDDSSLVEILSDKIQELAKNSPAGTFEKLNLEK
jgi:hypothetical protein